MIYSNLLIVMLSNECKVCWVSRLLCLEHELKNLTTRWSMTNKHDHPMNGYGLWAYDATLALGNAAEELGNRLDHFNLRNLHRTYMNSTPTLGRTFYKQC